MPPKKVVPKKVTPKKSPRSEVEASPQPKKKARTEGATPSGRASVGGGKLQGEVDPDLPMTPEGKIYHLDCKSGDIADKFIFVGDPGRVPIVAKKLDKVTFTNQHREIAIATGTYKGVRVTVLSTGMGTDNVEIVMNEIHALKEYDVQNNKWNTGKPPNVHIIRLGTCGCPRPDVDVGTLAITRHGVGMDNTCRYYADKSVKVAKSAELVANAVNKTELGRVGVYGTLAHPDVTAAIADQCKKAKQKYIVGATASGSGFYGCQGRAIGRFRGTLTCPGLVDALGHVEVKLPGGEVERFVNIEMENSAICYLSHILGYKAGTVCAIIAKRAGETREFASPDLAQKTLEAGMTIALDALISLK